MDSLRCCPAPEPGGRFVLTNGFNSDNHRQFPPLVRFWHLIAVPSMVAEARFELASSDNESDKETSPPLRNI